MANRTSTESAKTPEGGFRGRVLNQRRVALLVSIALLILFPDVILFLVLKLLHFLVSWLSLQFKHALQAAFDLSRHTAQMITAWIEVGLVIGFNIWLFRKLNARVQAWYLGWQNRHGRRAG